MTRLGVPVRLVLPPWPSKLSPDTVLDQVGARAERSMLSIESAQLMHPRFGFWLYVQLNRRALQRASAVYCRDVEIALALAHCKVACHVEIHDVAKAESQGHLAKLIDAHDQGRIQTLLPISEQVKNRLIQAGAEAKRIVVARSGVDVEAYRDLPAVDETRIANGQPRVVYLGRLSDSRGLEVLIQLAERQRIDLTLIGPTEDPIDPDRLAQAKITRHDWVDPKDAVAWYGKSDVVLMPYQPSLGHADSISPIKLFEAMAAGRPMMASDLPAIREIATSASPTGEPLAKLVTPDDVDAWEQALVDWQNDSAKAMAMARLAKEAAQPFDWKQRARTILRGIGVLT